ncbi:hypothetical protein PGB90_002009 [Kerria lacca]
MNSILFFVFICEFLIFIQTAQIVKLPKGFLKCKQNEPNFNDCVLEASNLAVPELVKGQPKFGIPIIDPLRIINLQINQGHGPVSIKLNFTDLDIIGISSSTVSDVKIDFNTYQIKVKLYQNAPLTLSGQYAIDGKVLVLPINGKGPCNLTLYDFKEEVDGHFEPIEKNGEIFWILKKMKFDFTTSKLYINLENLFNGDKNLGPQMNIFLNENWHEILEELRPAISDALATIFTQIAQRFFERVPITHVFPKK